MNKGEKARLHLLRYLFEAREKYALLKSRFSPLGCYRFGAFHNSLGSILCTESELKSDGTVSVLASLVWRKILIYNFSRLDFMNISSIIVRICCVLVADRNISPSSID
jgi:hypothetical protein